MGIQSINVRNPDNDTYKDSPLHFTQLAKFIKSWEKFILLRNFFRSELSQKLALTISHNRIPKIIPPITDCALADNSASLTLLIKDYKRKKITGQNKNYSQFKNECIYSSGHLS